MSQNADDLGRLGDLAFDNHDYDEAAQFFRQAALMVEPTPSILYNSGLAVEFSQLAFLQTIVKKYSDSLECRLAEIIWLIKLKANARAVVECNQLLTQYSAYAPGPLDIRFLRLQASVRNRDFFNLILEDCAIIWKLANQMDNPKPTKMSLLRELVAVSDPMIAPVLVKLSTQGWVTANIQLLLQKKAAELALFQKIDDELLES